jgi:hypothetical protein
MSVYGCGCQLNALCNWCSTVTCSRHVRELNIFSFLGRIQTGQNAWTRRCIAFGSQEYVLFHFFLKIAILLFMIRYTVPRGIFPDVACDMLLLSAVYIWAEGARYEGEYKEDKKNGRGVQTWPSGARCRPHPVASLACKPLSVPWLSR